MVNNSTHSFLQEELKKIQQEHCTEPLFHYLTLLNKWNKTYNLTAIRNPDEMVSKHLIDSLAIIPWVQGTRIIDVGTGAGLPGIPLAIAQPDKHFTLLDANGKKTRFLNEVKRQLALENVEIVHFRVESYHPHPGFDTVMSRAFTSLAQMIYWTNHLIAPDRLWLAMKGRLPDTELQELMHDYTVEPYSVNRVEGERCCILIKNTQPRN